MSSEQSDSILDSFESTQEQLGHIQLDADICKAANEYGQKKKDKVVNERRDSKEDR
jgi:DNA-directed RNA polymerase subunit H (RpoH/RPB5)